jgi:hypothetical protein
MLMLINPYEARRQRTARLPPEAKNVTEALKKLQSVRSQGLTVFEELDDILSAWGAGTMPLRRRLAPALQRSMTELQRLIPAALAPERTALKELQNALLDHGPALLRACETPRTAPRPRREAQQAQVAPWWFRLSLGLIPCIPWLDANAPARSLCLVGLNLWRQHHTVS